ncbi:pyridine nucleotide-disulfide oxidoreductase [Sphingopyxis sp. Root1497]|uniref:NAD(P)/FAD-dependent oxidoreductase n=1 Tax=Sphingopyxis sp. Root1497 TaxID=1736474 RepID=UPI0006FD3292|nr:FAD-dependent oxidoreductase [Sphingopyxis sp. Root1497]KQZ65011.1 pyridine nucleotide-disulfide oxidoreductase [Sphingopyxis sp. Root1497]
MTQKIIIAGSGFAGLWASISAARAIALAGKEGEVEVTIISPVPTLAIRPRLYEAVLENMDPDLTALLAAVGVRHVAGWVESVDHGARTISVTATDGSHRTLDYDRFILAAGSRLFRPDIPGLAEHGFEADQLETAYALDAHLKALASRPDSDARNTVVVAGGGLTGLEAATEMPIRLRAALGQDAGFRVVIVDNAPEIGAQFGLDALAQITEALAETGVESRAGVRVTAMDADSVTLSSGEKIATNTVVWTAGMRASDLAVQLPGDHDALGRVIGDAYLRAPAANGVFVTGDTVKVPTDDLGNYNPMSCQHAMSLGRVAGHNAAAELVGLPLHPYSQPKYVTCLDLGEWGALYTEGWDRQVRFTRDEGKKIKQEINTVWIYPPAADRDAVFAVANPDFMIVP